MKCEYKYIEFITIILQKYYKIKSNNSQWFLPTTLLNKLQQPDLLNSILKHTHNFSTLAELNIYILFFHVIYKRYVTHTRVHTYNMNLSSTRKFRSRDKNVGIDVCVRVHTSGYRLATVAMTTYH